MKIHLLAFATLSLFAATVARADSYSSKEPFSQRSAFSPTGTVSLENVNGNIEIRTWDKNEILVEGEKSAKTDEERRAIDLKIDVSENRATIKVRLPKRAGSWFSGNTIRAAVRFTLTVPASAVLERIQTVNAGVTLAGVRGKANIETVNGSIRATDLGGSAKLETVNGRIEVNFSSVTSGQALSFETVNGSIHVALPKDAGVALRTSVVNGRVNCDFPLTLTNSSGKRNLSGTIGDGRASLEAETVNGSIKIAQR